ncbi:MAG: hypothetical protein H8K03_04465 [Nitrospira sp.]
MFGNAILQSPLVLGMTNVTVLVVIGFLLSSCAIYYRDRDTGAEHIVGFGHLSVKAVPPNEGKQALIQRMTLTGIAVGLDNGSLGVSAGWDRREHILITNENAAITIARPPSNDFFYFKVGTYPPDLGIVPPIKDSDSIEEPQ